MGSRRGAVPFPACGFRFDLDPELGPVPASGFHFGGWARFRFSTSGSEFNLISRLRVY